MTNKWQTSPEYNRVLFSPEGDKISVQSVSEGIGPSTIQRAVRLDRELIPRILACLNACEGVPTGELKPGLMTDLLERAGEVT